MYQSELVLRPCFFLLSIFISVLLLSDFIQQKVWTASLHLENTSVLIVLLRAGLVIEFPCTVFLTLLVLCSSFTSSENLSHLDTLFLTFWATKIWKTAKHLYIGNTLATCVSFPQRWQQQLGCFDLCVGFVQPSASCCDIQTELRVISLEDLWLPHKSRKPADQHQLPGEGDVCLFHRPATATMASLVSPNRSLFCSRLTNDQGWSR